jgi:subtilisin family serine protease
MIFSAGNTANRQLGSFGFVCFPASLSVAVSVGATSPLGFPANYSPRGKIDLVAVSGAFTDACVGAIVTVDRFGSAGCSDGPELDNGQNDPNYTVTFSGTSAAAPQVAAVAALILSRFPTLTSSQVKSRLFNGAIPWGATNDAGHGKVSAYNSVF